MTIKIGAAQREAIVEVVAVNKATRQSGVIELSVGIEVAEVVGLAYMETELGSREKSAFLCLQLGRKH